MTFYLLPPRIQLNQGTLLCHTHILGSEHLLTQYGIFVDNLGARRKVSYKNG